MDDVIHRGITIRQFELPGRPLCWSDDQHSLGGIANSLDEARGQIDQAIFLRGQYLGWKISRLHFGQYEARGRSILSGEIATVLDQIDAVEAREVCP